MVLQWLSRMHAAKPVTLREIAKHAGVSVMTVSRALRNHSNLAPNTRARIKQLAERMGYRPNPLVSALMTYRRARKTIRSNLTLGFITNYPARDGWKNLINNTGFYEGALESADRHGFKIEEFWLREPKMTSKRLSNILFSRNITGLIIAPLPVASGHLRLDWEKFCCVTLGYSLVLPAIHRAANNQFRSMRLALRRLRKKGYERVGLALHASMDERVDHSWVGAFLVEQRRLPSEDPQPMLVAPGSEWNEQNFLKWFRKSRPEVIISQNEEILDWLDRAGLDVPNDVGFVHLNCPDMQGSFAGIYQNGPTVGAVAVDFLVGLVQRNERGVPELPHYLLVEGTWMDGKTLS